MGTKIFVDVTKFDIDECISRISKELLSVQRDLNKHQEAEKGPKEDENTDSDESFQVEEPLKEELPPIDWNEERVDQWAQSIHLNKSIQRKVLPCNGKLLYQYYTIHKTVPEFFYTTICKTSDGDLGLKELAVFSMELCSLFEQQK